MVAKWAEFISMCWASRLEVSRTGSQWGKICWKREIMGVVVLPYSGKYVGIVTKFVFCKVLFGIPVVK